MDSSVLKNILEYRTSPLNGVDNIPHLMIFVEHEPINAKAYMKLISKKLYLPIEIYDTADNALYDIESGFSDDKIYYILNDEKIPKNQEYITAFKESDKYVIVGFDGVKIPDSFLNDNAQYVYTFEKGTLPVLMSYIRKRIGNTVSDANLKHFIECCDYKLSQINNELDKAITYGDFESFFMLNMYPDIRVIDPMSVYLMIINKDSQFIHKLDILINNAVQSLLAMYTMARKKFVMTNDKYYAKLMVLCFKAHSCIIDGTATSENAIKKFVSDLMFK